MWTSSPHGGHVCLQVLQGATWQLRGARGRADNKSSAMKGSVQCAARMSCSTHKCSQAEGSRAHLWLHLPLDTKTEHSAWAMPSLAKK